MGKYISSDVYMFCYRVTTRNVQFCHWKGHSSFEVGVGMHFDPIKILEMHYIEMRAIYFESDLF